MGVVRTYLESETYFGELCSVGREWFQVVDVPLYLGYDFPQMSENVLSGFARPGSGSHLIR